MQQNCPFITTGVTDTTLSWIESYLSCRSFFVRIGLSSAPVTHANSVVPQGFVLGAILFTTYVAPISLLINSYGINHHKYADDTQLYTALVKPPRNDLQRLESCAAGLQHWFWENDLLLNPDKSEVCFFGTRQKLSRTPLPSTVTIAGCPIMVSDKVKTLGVTLDAALTFEDYVNNVAKACNFHMWDLRHISRSISRDVANNMAACIVDTRLNYCNALSYGATDNSPRQPRYFPGVVR